MGLENSETNDSANERKLREKEAAGIFVSKGVEVSRKGQNVAATMRNLGLVPGQIDCKQVWEVPNAQTNETQSVNVRVTDRFVQLKTRHVDQTETTLTIHRSLKPGSTTETNDYVTLRQAKPSVVEEAQGPQLLISADRGIELQNQGADTDSTDLRSYLPEWGRLIQHLAENSPIGN